MKIVVGSTHLGERFIDDLRREFPQVEFAAAYTAADQAREARDADVYFGWPDRRTFLSARKLKWIACPGMGIDKITAVEEIVNSAIPVTNAPGAHVTPMAEYTLGVMLALAHKSPRSWAEQKERQWRPNEYQGKIIELAGRTVGIYGLGAIGRAIAKRAAAFEMAICAVDPSPSEIPPQVKECWPASRLDDLCRVSDWLIVAAPYIPATRLAIDRRRIGLMKRGSYVVVVSRGGIIDEAALAQALASGQMAGAALDATEIEPLPQDSPLWSAPNAIITPHVSALSPELYENRRKIFRENLRRFLAGAALGHMCDKRAGY